MNTPESIQPSDPNLAKKVKLENWNLRVGIVAGVITLLLAIAGFLGIRLHNTNDEKQQAIGAVQTLEIVVSTQGAALTQNSSELQSASSQIDSLNSVSSSQAAVIVSMSSQLAGELTPTTPPSSATTSSTPVAPTGAVYHPKDRLTLAYGGDGADLDAPAGDARWAGDGNKDVNYGPGIGALYLATGVEGLVLPKGVAADFNSCNTSGYAPARIVVAGLEPGAGYCVLTEDGRFAAATLVGVDGSNLIADVVVFE